ncbi:MAG: COX15/CtaA family protein [Rhizobiales bacterium]|nr:COX15/CtaA family protein [Hyphomicrobiales bacterium]
MVALATYGVSTAEPGTRRLGAVRVWLAVLIFLVFGMVLVGGATRLTESGLSITEWRPIAGAIPPMGEAAWQAAFELYRRSPQYELLNRGMSLAEFQAIFWWEWAHRELGRFIGLVYIAGFFWFAIKRAVPPRTMVALALMGVLLGAQGFVGWIMVASGLEPGMSAVAPVKLALHLILASLFFAALVATFVGLGGAASEAAPPRVRGAARLLVLLGFAQIALGGLVAGHDAGLTYNTWPLMDGRWVPNGLWLLQPAWLNLVDNVTTIQFNHRIGAYVLAASIVGYAIALRGAEGPARGRAVLMLALVLAQMALGIMTLVLIVPISLALAHQGVALVLLLVLVWNASVLQRGARAKSGG